jgi:hypothetical protein
MDKPSPAGKPSARARGAGWTYRQQAGATPNPETIMNIRIPLAALSFCLASGMALAATTPATPATPAVPAKHTAAAPAKLSAHKLAKECKAKGETLVKGKCEKGKAQS